MPLHGNKYKVQRVLNCLFIKEHSPYASNVIIIWKASLEHSESSNLDSELAIKVRKSTRIICVYLAQNHRYRHNDIIFSILSDKEKPTEGLHYIH